MSERYEDVILEEARRAIDFQASALDELWARTGILLAAAAVSGSFLAAATARADVGFGFLGGVAVVAFVLDAPSTARETGTNGRNTGCPRRVCWGSSR